MRDSEVKLPAPQIMNRELLTAPLPPDEAARIELRKEPNIGSLPELEPIPDDVVLPVLFKVGDELSNRR